MGMEWRRGQMSAWLLKKKSGTAMMRMRQYNKRFFTIDFDTRVFFYAHGEGSKKVSHVMDFREILEVDAPKGARPSMMGAVKSEDHGGNPAPEKKRGSMFSRSFSGLSGAGSKKAETAEPVHHYINVEIGVQGDSKTMELLCSSQSEADQWYQGFREAMQVGRESGGGGRQNVTAVDGIEPCSDDDAEADSGFRTVNLEAPVSESTPSRSAQPRVPTGAVAAAAIAAATAAVAAPTGAAVAAAAAERPVELPRNPSPPAAAGRSQGGGYGAPAQGGNGYAENEVPPAAAAAGYAATAPPVAPAPRALQPRVSEAAPAAVPIVAAPVAPSPGAPEDDAEGDDAAPPPAKAIGGSFLDFDIEPAAPEPVLGAGPSPGPGDVVATTGGEQEAVVETGGIMQGTDFGFDADDSSGSGSAISTPREGATDTFAGLTSPSGAPAAPAEPDASPTPKAEGAPGGRGTYGDRQAGQSMQERLANLEFSDDEDDDPDDPLGLKQK